MSDSILLNDGSSFVLLNDGSSHVLLNAHAEAGLTISGTHSFQALYDKRPVQHIPIEFTFILKAGILAGKLQKLLKKEIKLNPKGIYTQKLAESFLMSTTKLKDKVNPLIKKAQKEYLEAVLYKMHKDEFFEKLEDKYDVLKDFIKHFNERKDLEGEDEDDWDRTRNH